LETSLLPLEVLGKSRNIAAQDASGGVAIDVDVKDDKLHKVYKDISVMTSLSTANGASLDPAVNSDGSLFEGFKEKEITPSESGSLAIRTTGDDTIGDMSLNELRSQGLGTQPVVVKGHQDEGNGGTEALEGSLIEGSGKALIRNGRMHLLEWKPMVNRPKYDDLAPSRPHSSNSHFSESPYWARTPSGGSRSEGRANSYGIFSSFRGPSDRPGGSNSHYNSRRGASNAKPFSKQWREKRSEGYAVGVDHLKIRQAAQEWLSAQTNIRSKLLGLLPDTYEHDCKKKRSRMSVVHKTGTDPDAEKAERGRHLRLRKLLKGDLQTELDGKIGLEVLARVLGVALPSKSAMTVAKGGSQPMKKAERIRGGIYFPTFNNVEKNKETPVKNNNFSAHGGLGGGRLQTDALTFRELSDVFKALDLDSSGGNPDAIKGRIEVPLFLQFVFDPPKRNAFSALPPRPRSATSQLLRDKNPFKIEPAWERELKHLFLRCCSERALAGLDMAGFLKAIHETGLAQDCVSGSGFEGISIEDARHQFLVSVQSGNYVDSQHADTKTEETGKEEFKYEQDCSEVQSGMAREESEALKGQGNDRSSKESKPSMPEGVGNGEGGRGGRAGAGEGAGCYVGGVGLFSEAPESPMFSKTTERPEYSADGVMNFKQFIHSVQSLVLKGGKIASALVSSRVGGRSREYANQEVRRGLLLAEDGKEGNVGRELEGEDAQEVQGGGSGHIQRPIDYDDIQVIRNDGKERGFSTVSRERGGRRRRRPSSAMGRMYVSEPHVVEGGGRIRPPAEDEELFPGPEKESDFFDSGDAIFLRSVARQEAVYLIRQAELQAKATWHMQVQGKLESQNIGSDSSTSLSMHRDAPKAAWEAALDRVYSPSKSGKAHADQQMVEEAPLMPRSGNLKFVGLCSLLFSLLINC
jgi:hypothetical protein